VVTPRIIPPRRWSAVAGGEFLIIRVGGDLRFKVAGREAVFISSVLPALSAPVVAVAIPPHELPGEAPRQRSPSEPHAGRQGQRQTKGRGPASTLRGRRPRIP